MSKKWNLFYSWKMSVVVTLIGVAAVISLRLALTKDIESFTLIHPVTHSLDDKLADQNAVNIGSLEKQAGEVELTERIVKLESSLKALRSQLANNEINEQIAKQESSLKALSSQLTGDEMNATSNQEVDMPDDVSMNLEALERAQTDSLVSFLDQQIYFDGVDAVWSGTTKAEIAEAFTEDVFLNAVDCYSTLCRISADHANQDAEQNFIQKLIGLEAFLDTDAFIERHENDDGSISTRIFIARGGHRLPDPATQ